MMDIAILGANSHIAKNLIVRYLNQRETKLYLFGRRRSSILGFLQEIGYDPVRCQVLSYDSFNDSLYDAVINCVGVADPGKQKTAGFDIFHATEFYDNLALQYVKSHSETKYLNFSSGAVYGTAFSEPVSRNTIAHYEVNNLTAGDFYRIAKLYSEAKHRSLPNLFIIDLRVFGFFSRYIDLNSTFLLTEIINCIRRDSVFKTNDIDIVRDYIHPDDLFRVLEFYLKRESVKNESIDLRSNEPITKFEIISLFTKSYGLKHQISDSDNVSVTGLKKIYYSQYDSSLAGGLVKHTSKECLETESLYIL